METNQNAPSETVGNPGVTETQNAITSLTQNGSSNTAANPCPPLTEQQPLSVIEQPPSLVRPAEHLQEHEQEQQGAGKAPPRGQTPAVAESAEVGAEAPLSPPPRPPESASSAAPESEKLVLSVLGKLRDLSETEQAAYFACEEVLASGWNTFVQVGLALAQIRDQELYRGEFDSFEAYYRTKWQYGRHYVNRLISAAQVFTHLVTNRHQTAPEHETQVRPLIGLTPEEAKA